jgi:hypothetical protein
VVESGVQVNQSELELALSAGKQATASRNYKQAIYHYCTVLIAMMRDARAKADAKDNESIDY